MSKRLEEIQQHKKHLMRRSQIDKYIVVNNLLEYKNKALRFKTEIDREEFLEWLIDQLQHYE